MATLMMEEFEFMNDGKYRMYVAAVDKALKNFDYTSEWADLISALGKLNKVLLSYTKFPVIPRRIKISKRLAQCMHPALPSGVHLKALETYDIIFKSMGTNRLAGELFIYSAGLFPLLGHAAMNIRPMLLTIYETHFVPLSERLRPALSGFLSGVLPGLEPGSDHFDRTNTLLETVCEGVGPAWFYTCIWQCVHSNGPVRLPAISYILAHYSKRLVMEDQLYLMGNDIDVMISGLCAAVQDSSVLVQRSALDLLMVCFPMQNTLLLYADMVRLVTASLSTILRRDMSLNRRLYSWLLNNENNGLIEETSVDVDCENSSQGIAFDLLMEAIRTILKQSCNETPIDIKPYRLLTSLFDKPKIGPVILDTILYDVFRALYLCCLNQQKHKNDYIRCVSYNGNLNSLNCTENTLSKDFVNKRCQELIKNANLLFNTLQSYYIWSYIERLYEKAVKSRKKVTDKMQVSEIGSGEPHLLEICILTDFLLDIIPIETYTENTMNILPNLFKCIIFSMRKNLPLLEHNEITLSLELCTKILRKVQPITVKQSTKPELEANQTDVVNAEPMQEMESNMEIRTGLEKSKSDSKINENMNRNELTIENNSRERSNSNQMLIKRRDKSSPKIDKKTRSKKSKSSSKLYDIKKEENVEQSVIDSTETVDVTVQESTETTTTKTETEHIIKCLETYKSFYSAFIQSKILKTVNVDVQYKQLINDKEERTKRLEKLLNHSLNSDDTFELDDGTGNQIVVKNWSEIMAPSVYAKTMSIASNILLEFSTFSDLLQEHSMEQLPQWLKVILVCVCSYTTPIDVRITAMSTLLDLFSLAKSQNVQKKTENNVVLIGIISIHHMNFIEESTTVLETMSKTLWDLLSVLSNQNQVMLCVTLLYNIHNIFDQRPFVEEVIGASLIQDAGDHFKKFALLWHLGRDLNIKLSIVKNSVRNFDRSLLKVLDNLQNPQRTNIRLLSEAFLNHSLIRNDMPRIISPILVKLLAPSTARISICFVNIQDTDSPSDASNQYDAHRGEERTTKNVYAVSNIDGNVMYHIANDPSPKQFKKKWYLFSKAGKKYTPVVNMTTTITENLGVITKKNKDFKVDVSPKFERTKNNNVKLIINPLSTKEIYPDGVDGSYTKLDVNESRHSSTESLNSLNDLTETSNDSSLKLSLTAIHPNPSYLHQDSGFESHSSFKSSEKKSPALMGEKEELICKEESKAETKITKSISFDEKTSDNKVEHLSLVHSWSYCISDSDKDNYAELELSTSAEEFFKDKNRVIVIELLNEIIDDVCKEAGELPSKTKFERPVELDVKPKMPDQSSKNVIIYPVHQHICLYYEVFETDQVLYAFRSLKGCLSANPEVFIKCLATSGIKDLRSNQILHLLAKHRKSVQGSGFSGDLSQEHLNFYRGYTFLDIVLCICLNYLRTYFPALDDIRLTEEEIENNFLIQLECLEILEIIISNLIRIVSENTKGFAGYIADTLLKCMVQKILLHCLFTAVRNFDDDLSFAEEVLLFNGFKLYDHNKRVSDHVEAFQIQLLRLMYYLIVLEYNVNNETSVVAEVISSTANGEHLTYTPAIVIPEQPLFLSATNSALRHQNMKCLHQNWTCMITSSLPYFGRNLKQIAINVLSQLCSNIEKLADCYRSTEIAGQLCSDYAITQLESLTVLCHYCLLDSTQTTNQNAPIASEILNNLMNAFFSPMPNSANVLVKQNSDHYQEARHVILSHMPRILSSVAKLWQTIVTIEGEYNGVFGSSKIVKQQLLEFLSPIAVHHSASFIAAVAVAWYERRNPFANVKTILPEPNTNQSNLVYLILAIRVIPLDNLVQTVIAVIKNPPPIEGLKNDVRLDVSVLELFYCYIRYASATQLSEAWSSLLMLVRDGCSLSAPSQFLLAALLHELMIKCCPLEEKKDQRDLQDVTAKLIECVSQVCGSCLEQTTWLRRNLAVKESDENGLATIGLVNGGSSDICIGTAYSVHAQLVLSEILAPILDICFGSSEKDKVSTILTSLMYNIVPYLKTHTSKNMPSFKACSKLLASLSSYQYTRKAWKKDVFELLLDSTLFQMDHTCLKYWKTIVDNLMTHDNTTFRELMSRVSPTQTGSLNIFSSREQENEQKAQLLKRLAFVIFCSENDQYAKYMPDIQEQLTTNLRYNVPGIQAQVFMCFRVLLIRMSPIHVTSLWPIIISEMLQVFLQIEQELTTDTEEFRNNNSSHIKLLSGLDASWTMNSSNGLHALGHPHYLRLQLSVAKLLDLALIMPATSLPQFQMYRWAFVGDEATQSDSTSMGDGQVFTPHITRIAKLMDQKYSDNQIETLATKSNELLLVVNSISQLKDLHGFFKTLSLCSNRHRSECNGSTAGDHVVNDRQMDKKLSILLEKIDKVIENDFIEDLRK